MASWPSQMTTARTLVVDDDALTRDLLARVLRKDGHEVVEASDGTEALAQLRKQSGAPLEEKSEPLMGLPSFFKARAGMKAPKKEKPL